MNTEQALATVEELATFSTDHVTHFVMVLAADTYGALLSIAVNPLDEPVEALRGYAEGVVQEQVRQAREHAAGCSGCTAVEIQV